MSRSREHLHNQSPVHHSMSPRLTRKGRQTAYSSTSKLDNSHNMQVEQYGVVAGTEGGLSPIQVTSPGSPYAGRLQHRGDISGFDRYGSLDIRQTQESKNREKFGSLDRTAAMSRYGYRDPRDRSLDRSGNYSSGSMQRNRSLDRDYPMVSVSSRSLADGSDIDAEADLRFQLSQSSMLILSLQTQLVDLNKDYTLVQRELEQNKSQLNSYIASVKTFWSPELKKERGLRKEEANKSQKLQESLTANQHEAQILQAKLNNAEERLKLQDIKGRQSPDGATTLQTQDRDKYDKDIDILQKTISEMELRIDIQKKTLAARDASIKKLVEMLQTRNIPIETILNGEAEKDKLRLELASLERNLAASRAEAQANSLQANQLQETVSQLRSELTEALSSANRANRHSKNLEEVKALLDLKNTRISELEKELQDLDEQIKQTRYSAENVSEEKRQMEALHSREKVLFSKLENMRLELSSKNTEVLSLQNKLDTLQSNRSDLEQLVEHLKEQIANNDRNMDQLKSELHQFQATIKEMDISLDRKSSLIETLKADKMKLEGDLADSKYENEVIIHKFNLSQKKLENSEHQMLAKLDEIASLEERLASVAAQASHTETMAHLERVIADKNKQLDRLQEERNSALDEREEEVDKYQKANRDLNCELETLRQSNAEKQSELLELKESLSELKAEKLKMDSLLSHSEKTLVRITSEKDDLLKQIELLKNEMTCQVSAGAEQQNTMQRLEQQVALQAEQLQKYQKEIDRLLDILKEMENEKHNKDKQIRELHEQLKEAKQKFVNLKRSQQQADKKRTEDSQRQDGGESKVDLNEHISRYQERVEELEEALKQSVKITAKCEMVVAQQKEQIEKQNKQLQQFKVDLAKSQELNGHMKELEETLREKNEQLRRLVAERGQHMEELYEMKQEAILAAISEKDAHIALLEASKGKNARDEIDRLNSDKQRLNLRLKDLTTQRMLLVVEQSTDNSRMLTSQNQSVSA